ncbi:MAG: aminotransferase class I/II-fold pyridoxal phosphate-dependent enzyme, partial [Pseudomonadota bacterium]
MFPERFANLPEYAFPRLRALLDVHEAGGNVVHMTIGEPKHDFPSWIMEIINENSGGFRQYPINEGMPELNQAFCDWAKRRYGVSLDPDQNVMALNGTREGLYNAMMALSPESKAGGKPIVLLPNPFYQVYMVAALSVGAEPMLLPAVEENGFLPDFESLPAEVLDRVTVAYLCSPSNPQGAV